MSRSACALYYYIRVKSHIKEECLIQQSMSGQHVAVTSGWLF